MHIEFWRCDYCNKDIVFTEPEKYQTQEEGYPFIPKEGGGKHFHKICLRQYYRDKKLKTEDINILMADAQRRHDTHIDKKIKKGTLTDEIVKERKATAKDRNNLVNYFYSHYGVRAITKQIGTTIDRLNAGERIKEDALPVEIPYYQLKEMLLYYSKDLTKARNKKIKKGEKIPVSTQIMYDINVVINKLSDYRNRSEAILSQSAQGSPQNEIFDNSKFIRVNTKARMKKKDEEQRLMDELLAELEEDNRKYFEGEEDEIDRIFKEREGE